jgi:hypothetical protein
MDLIDVKFYLRLVINRVPKHIKHEHGLCITNLGFLLDSQPFTILSATHEQVDIQWKTEAVLMDVSLTSNNITIKDYTYIIPPFYKCTFPTHLHLHAAA